MGCPLLFALRILHCKSCQSETCSTARRAASSSSNPCLQNPSYDSSRCAPSSRYTSSFSAASRASPERRRRTIFRQSRMGHLREPLQRAEQLRPFLANRREFFLPLG